MHKGTKIMMFTLLDFEVKIECKLENEVLQKKLYLRS